MPVLRRELKEALQDACKVLEETQKNDGNSQSGEEEGNGFYEIQGLHLLDLITLAIRAAKNYYTAHSNPQKLYAMRSEKDIRADLYRVLDVLKRMASRNFRGGMRMSELTDIILWIESIDTLIKREEQWEQQEAAEREAMIWREGDWTSREREREWLFLKSFDSDGFDSSTVDYSFRSGRASHRVSQMLAGWTTTGPTPQCFCQAQQAKLRRDQDVAYRRCETVSHGREFALLDQG